MSGKAEVNLVDVATAVRGKEICNGFLIGGGRRRVFAILLLGGDFYRGFEFAVRAFVREFVDDAVDQQAVENTPYFEFARHARFSQGAQTLDRVPYP